LREKLSARINLGVTETADYAKNYSENFRVSCSICQGCKLQDYYKLY